MRRSVFQVRVIAGRFPALASLRLDYCHSVMSLGRAPLMPTCLRVPVWCSCLVVLRQSMVSYAQGGPCSKAKQTLYGVDRLLQNSQGCGSFHYQQLIARLFVFGANIAAGHTRWVESVGNLEYAATSYSSYGETNRGSL